MKLAFSDFNAIDINLGNFDCGVAELNDFIKQEAKECITKWLCAVRVLFDQESKQLLGFYSIAPASLEVRRLSVAYQQKMGVQWPIPCWIIGKLAVNQSYQHLGLGKIVLMGALESIVARSSKGEGALIIVDAKNKKVKKFYKHYDFTSLPNSGLRLILPIRHAKQMLELI